MANLSALLLLLALAHKFINSDAFASLVALPIVRALLVPQRSTEAHRVFLVAPSLTLCWSRTNISSLRAPPISEVFLELVTSIVDIMILMVRLRTQTIHEAADQSVDGHSRASTKSSAT